jgi:hypothetical protein
MVIRNFRPKKEGVAGGYRRLHSKEFHNLYAPQHIIRVIKSRRMKWIAHAACMVEMRNAYKIMIRKPDKKRPLGGPRHRWEDNIRMDLKEVGCDVDWILMAQDRAQ